MPVMARERTEPVPADERRIVLRPYTFGRLTKMAEREDETPTTLANQAVREFLKKHGYWEDASATADATEGD